MGKAKKDVETVSIVPAREDIERFSHLDTERKRVAAATALNRSGFAGGSNS